MKTAKSAKKAIAILLSLSMLASAGSVGAFAAEADAKKTETVYVVENSDGSAKETIVSVWLQNL